MNKYHILRIIVAIVLIGAFGGLAHQYGMDARARIDNVVVVVTPVPSAGGYESRIQTISQGIPAILSSDVDSGEKLLKFQAQCAKLALSSGLKELAKEHLAFAKSVAKLHNIDKDAIIYYFGFTDGMLTQMWFAQGAKGNFTALAKRHYHGLCGQSA